MITGTLVCGAVLAVLLILFAILLFTGHAEPAYTVEELARNRHGGMADYTDTQHSIHKGYRDW